MTANIATLVLIFASAILIISGYPTNLEVYSKEYGLIKFIPLGNFSKPVNGKKVEVYWFTTERALVADNANKICESLDVGVKSAALVTEDLNIAAKNYLDSHQINAVWTSGVDFKRNGDFYWRTPARDIPFTYEDFEKVAPFPNPNCQCVSIQRNRINGIPCDPSNCLGNYRWFEKPCSEKKRLLCELS